MCHEGRRGGFFLLPGPSFCGPLGSVKGRRFDWHARERERERERVKDGVKADRTTDHCLLAVCVSVCVCVSVTSKRELKLRKGGPDRRVSGNGTFLPGSSALLTSRNNAARALHEPRQLKLGRRESVKRNESRRESERSRHYNISKAWNFSCDKMDFRTWSPLWSVSWEWHDQRGSTRVWCGVNSLLTRYRADDFRVSGGWRSRVCLEVCVVWQCVCGVCVLWQHTAIPARVYVRLLRWVVGKEKWDWVHTHTHTHTHTVTHTLLPTYPSPPCRPNPPSVRRRQRFGQDTSVSVRSCYDSETLVTRY